MNKNWGKITNINKAKKKQHIGKIYAINPKHVVKNYSTYQSVKSSSASNRRLVMVGVQKSSNKVQISNMTTKATKSQISKKQRVRLETTYPNKNSYINTDTISKSKLTKKHFKIGEPPLIKVQNKAHPDDIIAYQKARKSRGR